MKFNQEVLEKKLKGTFVEFLNIQFEQDETPNTLLAKLKTKPEFMQTMGILHGGINNTLAETVAGVGSNLMAEEGTFFVGAQLSINHMRGIDIGDTVIAKGYLIHKGRKTHVWNVDIYSQETGVLASKITVTNIAVKNRKKSVQE